MSNFRIGVDGGGTTTRAVVIDGNLRALGRGEAGPGNFYSAGEKAAVENIIAAIEAAVQSANIEKSQISSWGLGLAGACSESDRSAQRAALLPHAGAARVVVDEDAPAAQAGAFAGGPGAICIAGTGANCFGVNEKGERRGADGYGPLLGDRGSGYWCGEQALRAACASFDGSGPQTPLQDAVFRQLGAQDVFELIQIVYATDFKKDRIAALFPTLLQVAAQGDVVAQQILQRAGNELAKTTLAVLRPLEIHRVAPVGGLLANDTPVRPAYEAALREAIPQVEFIAPLHDAAIGAALLAK
jgi:N-acetylglucosamine kinase-like BadF-type ATPase